MGGVCFEACDWSVVTNPASSLVDADSTFISVNRRVVKENSEKIKAIRKLSDDSESGDSVRGEHQDNFGPVTSILSFVDDVRPPGDHRLLFQKKISNILQMNLLFFTKDKIESWSYYGLDLIL